MSDQHSKKDPNDLMMFGEETPESAAKKESMSWIKRAGSQSSRIIAEVTGIHLLKDKSKENSQQDEEDSYSPMDESTNARTFMPSYDAQGGQQFGKEVESGFTDFNNVVQDFSKQANKQYTARPIKRRTNNKKSGSGSFIVRVAILVTLALVGMAAYKKALRWSETSQSAAAKVLRKKFNSKTPPQGHIKIKKNSRDKMSK